MDSKDIENMRLREEVAKLREDLARAQQQVAWPNKYFLTVSKIYFNLLTPSQFYLRSLVFTLRIFQKFPMWILMPDSHHTGDQHV